MPTSEGIRGLIDQVDERTGEIQAELVQLTAMRGHLAAALQLTGADPTKPKPPAAEVPSTVKKKPPAKKARIREKEYKCDRCTKKYTTRDALTKHKLSHNDGQPKVHTFPCFQCEGGGSSSSALLDHMEDSHPDLMFYCKVCDKRWQDEGDRDKHESESHPEYQEVLAAAESQPLATTRVRHCLRHQCIDLDGMSEDEYDKHMRVYHSGQETVNG